MILKEWTCKSCSLEFEAPGPSGGSLICPECGCLAERAFRTPPQVDTQKGHSRNVDRLIAAELKERKISNYSQRFGEKNQVTYESDFTQGHCSPVWGRAGLNQILAEKYGAGPLNTPTVRTLDAAPLERGNMMAPDSGGKIDWKPNASTHKPETLLNHTQVIARTDEQGNQI